MSEIQGTDQNKQQLRTLLRKYEGKIAAMVPRHLDGRRLFQVYMVAAQKGRGLSECLPMSIIGAIVQAAQLGLSLDTVFGEAYLIPRWNKHQQAKVAQFQIGYKGLRKLALQADPELRDVYAHEVYEHDHFSYTYEPPELKFRPAEDPEARGKLKYAYAKAIWRDEYDRFVVLTTPEINKIKKASDAATSKDSPWTNWEEAMWRKSALRKLLGSLTLSADSPIVKAMGAEDVDGEEAAEMEALPSIEDAPQLGERQPALDAVADSAGEQQEAPKQRRRRRADAEA